MKRLLLLFIPLFILSCKKDEEDKTDTPPVIEYLGLSESTVTEFQNQVILSLAYEDLEGDLGSDDPDDYPLEIKDSRLNEADYYFVQPLAPLGYQLKIDGTLEVNLSSFFVLGNAQQELSTLRIRIRDRAGNWSNMVQSETITIQKAP